jgi:heme/copper-type cytochrome/quinol oxidase subunit 2
VNALQGSPDFLMFSGDETHTTDDPAVRRQRMTEFKGIIGGLNVGTVRFLPGEHDSALDNGQAYREAFGDLYYAFDVKGVHFIALDNVSSGNATLGDAQIAWLKNVLAGFDPGSQIIVFAHRPLLDVYPQWDWRTRDGAQALALLSTFKNVTLFYGHIHQLRTDSNGWFTQYAARGLMFPLPLPGSVPSPGPVLWDAQHPYQGLGFRAVRVNTATKQISVTEYPLSPAATSMAPAAGTAPAAVPAAVSTTSDGTSIRIVAQRSQFTPNVIHVRRNVPVTLELTSLDTKHGFSCPDLNVEAVIVPGTATRVALTASRPGEYGFACDIFCGDGHENMVGRIIVE